MDTLSEHQFDAIDVISLDDILDPLRETLLEVEMLYDVSVNESAEKAISQLLL